MISPVNRAGKRQKYINPENWVGRTFGYSFSSARFNGLDNNQRRDSSRLLPGEQNKHTSIT
jgi:hypothetical protein